ncbi:MAG: enoyl-CoA hydratase/isomerase family protein [Chloroflexi bacterium]|nr:enoyl-CoA hydratase/isomerase family protein [Chloroflexota bacterium]
MEAKILLNKKGPLATITINRPDRRNAITYDMWTELHKVALMLDNDQDIRIIIFQGAGEEAFSAGADISEFGQRRSNSGQARLYDVAYQGALDTISQLRMPTVGLIKGACTGGGLELATTLDIRISADNARFGMPIGRLSMLSGFQQLRRLVNIAGPAVVKDLLLTARLMGTEEALRVGLVNVVRPLRDVEAYCQELAMGMAELAPLSQAWHKQMIRVILMNPDLEGLTPAEEAMPYILYDSEDFREGWQAFLDKRKPIFKGK